MRKFAEDRERYNRQHSQLVRRGFTEGIQGIKTHRLKHVL